MRKFHCKWCIKLHIPYSTQTYNEHNVSCEHYTLIFAICCSSCSADTYASIYDVHLPPRNTVHFHIPHSRLTQCEQCTLMVTIQTLITGLNTLMNVTSGLFLPLSHESIMINECTLKAMLLS